MDINPFEIEVEIEVPIGQKQVPVQIHVDLSQPQFESAVVAAAGHFYQARRKSRKGGRKARELIGGKRTW